MPLLAAPLRTIREGILYLGYCFVVTVSTISGGTFIGGGDDWRNMRNVAPFPLAMAGIFSLFILGLIAYVCVVLIREI